MSFTPEMHMIALHENHALGNKVDETNLWRRHTDIDKH